MLSANFNRMEFACGCHCGFGLRPGDIDPLLITALQLLRNDLCGPLYISSACRCFSHNARVGGAENSQHLRGRAADVYGFSPQLIRQAALEVKPFANGGIGFYPSAGFVHLDVRETAARWEE